jgi:uncharacterized membrane protein YdfJ with MMPL/SSD domain
VRQPRDRGRGGLARLVVLVRLVVWGVGAETSNDLSLPGTES